MLQELRDREAVKDVVLRYAAAVDRRDFDAVAACFTPDAEYAGALAHGRVGDALASLRRSLARYEGTMHFVGNQLVEVTGDSAACETYAIAYHRSREAGELRDLAVAVRYRDDLVRDAGAWRIRKRDATTLWTRVDPVRPGALPGGQ